MINNTNTTIEKLNRTGEATCLTSGVSMYPLIRGHRDIVVIKKLSQPLLVGDVPLYKYDTSDKLILHRIIKILPDGRYVIRGDNTYIKEYVPPENIVGVLTAIYRDGKYIDCKSSRGYKLYMLSVKITFPVRWMWKRKLRPILSKIKYTLIK